MKTAARKPKAYRGPELMGAAEIAALFDVTTQLVNQWRKASTFPAPAELSCGRIWLRREILAWAKRYRPDLLERMEASTNEQATQNGSRKASRGRKAQAAAG